MLILRCHAITKHLYGGLWIITKLFVSWTLGQMIIFHIRLCGVGGGKVEGLKIVSCQPDIYDCFSCYLERLEPRDSLFLLQPSVNHDGGEVAFLGRK